MRNNPMQKALEALQKHPRCGAHARQTGAPCLGWAMKNGRCRMHGGKSPGRPLIHGNCTKNAIALRNEIRLLLIALSTHS
jgi:hypothetical protein